MKTVFVGLSGGVDSAVSAALLKQQGYNVVGAFIKIWQPEFLECTWKKDRLDAMRVCAALSIPFREVDLSEEYKNEVVKNMVADYAAGQTPNPDVLCNRSIKFGHFRKWALRNGADIIATGHYARILKAKDSYQLLRGVDATKDQSYFLYRLDQTDLPHTLFPVGGFEKKEVRALAAKFDIPVAQKNDSQGLCFVGDVSMKEFLARFISLEKGNVLGESGAIVGTHDGAALYTIGERHGFAVSGGTSHYVVGIDTKNNIVRVSSKRETAQRNSVTLKDVSWTESEPSFPLNALAQARYHEKPVEVTLEKEQNSFIAEFNEPHVAANGQSLVLYDGERCLGGGIINT